MKVTKLIIHNIGLIAHEEIPFEHPLMLFYGEVRQAKTTILNSVRWCFGGAFPSDIIRHGEKDAFIEVDLDEGIIRREFYVAKNEETKSRDLIYTRNSRPVPNPVNEIKRLLNPFLGNQDYLRNMGETERRQYFSQVFAVDTTSLDKELFSKDQEAQALRRKIKDYGEIDLTPVLSSNAAEIREKIKEARRAYNALVQEVGQHNTDATGTNGKRSGWREELEHLTQAMEELNRQLENKRARFSEVERLLADNPKAEIKPLPIEPDTSILDEQLEEATRNEERAKRLEENKAKAKQKADGELALRAAEQRMREIKAAKIAKLKDVSEKSGIAGLQFDEQGNFTYEGTQAGMLSTSQIMRLSSQLSAQYPKGLGIELIDRAESLGKSIFGFIDKAKAEEKTILATIVGEAPAKAPEDVGVFVVEQGRVTAKNKRTAKPQSEMFDNKDDVPCP